MTKPPDAVRGLAVLDDTNLAPRIPQATQSPWSDTYAWTSGVFLPDGRFATIAWLKDYPGAISATWRRYR